MIHYTSTQIAGVACLLSSKHYKLWDNGSFRLSYVRRKFDVPNDLNLPTRHTCSKVAIYTTLINPITKFAIYISPINRAVENAFPILKRRLFGLLFRMLWMASTVFVALAIPFFIYVMALIGAFLGRSYYFLLEHQHRCSKIWG